MSNEPKYQPDVVVVHYPCDDGWTAALIVQRYLAANNLKAAKFVPGNYDNKDDTYWLDLVRGKNVLVVDFSFKGPLRKKLETACASMLLLDHHASAKEEYGNEAIVFDEYTREGDHLKQVSADLEENKIVMLLADDKCGSSMAWDFFFPSEERPKLLEYIEDQDLGRRKLPGATSFTYWLRGQDQRKDHGNIEFLHSLDAPEDMESALEEGAIIYKFIKSSLINASKTVAIGSVFDTNEKFDVAISYCPYEFASEFATLIVGQYPKVMAAIIFYHLPDLKIGVSIRGQRVKGKNTTYARRIAESLGGGGHDMAAGANFANIAEFTEFLNQLTEGWGEVDEEV